MRHVRGGEIAMIFQEPMTSLNPVFTIGDQITEAVMLHNKVTKKEAGERAIESLRLGRASRPRSGGSSSTRTSCPAACASGP